MDLTDAQWAVLQPFLHPKPVRKRGRPWQDARAVFNGILWVLRTGAPWHDLPDRYPPYQTCHRRFQQWQRDGTLTRLLHALAEDLRARGKRSEEHTSELQSPCNLVCRLLLEKKKKKDLLEIRRIR